MKLRAVSSPVLIQSRENPRFRTALDLVQSSRERRKRQQTFIEGIHLCRAFLERGSRPLQMFATQASLENPQVDQLWQVIEAERVLLTPALFRELSQVEHGPAIAYVIETPQASLPETVSQSSVYLDRIQDPGNVGSILRSCAAAGVSNLFASPGTAFCWSPKVLRSAMGAHFLINIHEGVAWRDLHPRLRLNSLATAADAADIIWKSDLRSPCIWLFGNEGAGLEPGIRATVQSWVSIPIQTQVESLNVASAVAICLFEQRRQQSSKR